MSFNQSLSGLAAHSKHRRSLLERLGGEDTLTSAGSSFSSTYVEAREKFRSSLPEVTAYILPDLTGPEGEVLTVDAGWVGAPDAEYVLVAISGVHGPEGYCGSGIQIDWLHLMNGATLPANTAMIFLHGLNPHGFAWNRRVTHEGCDLNRNFVDFGKGTPANPGYDELREHLVPPALDGPVYEKAQEIIAAYKAKNGDRAFQIARKAGQYVDPDGMFFGGIEPTWSARTLDQIVRASKLEARKFAAIVDFHTGLGPYGYGELQSESRPLSVSHAIAVKMFGPSVTSADLGTSSSIPIDGTLERYWERLMGDGRYLYLGLEYGTFDLDAAHRVLLTDQWLHVHGGGDRTTAFGNEVRRRMRAHFSPEDPVWMEAVLFRGRQVLRQALAGLSEMARTR